MGKSRSINSRVGALALIAGLWAAVAAQPALAQSFCSVTTGMACVSDAGCPPGEECQVFVDDDITTSTTWSQDNVYRLTGVRYVLGGATLSIEPGTVIRGESNQPRCSVDNDLCTTNADCIDLSDPADICLRDPGALVVARGARINAQGTKLKPIIFTNLEDDNLFANSEPDPNGDYEAFIDAFDVNGTWGGVIMLGRGYTNNDTDNPGPQIGPNPARQLAVEGIQNRGRCTQTFNACRLDSQCPGALNTCDLFTGFYGDCASSALSPESCDDDTNGSMRYVSIRYGGDEVSAANEINGLTLGGVGRGTTLDYIEIANNFDDGVELFGGAVDIKHFVITNAGDDAVDYDEGWRGRGQFIFAMAGRPLSSDPRSGEHDGATGGDGGQPRAIPTFYNVTYIGAGGAGGGASGTDFHDPAETYGAKAVNANFIFRDNAGGQYYNSAFLNGGGALGLIEGSAASATDNETSGERTITAYALGDANTFASPVGSAPAGNCDDPTDPNDTATRALACNADNDCPGGAVCVLHYLSRGTAPSFELELQDNVWHCFGQPLLDGGGVAHFPATLAEVAAAGGEVGKLHRDIPGLFSAGSGLDNQYRRCTDPLPIRQLVRVSDPLFFPIGDGENQPVVSVDPRPAPGSVLLTTNRTPPSDGFFEPAAYKGAFGSDNWADGWTATARLGLFPSPRRCSVSLNACLSDADCEGVETCNDVNVVKVDADITTATTWTKDKEYVLTGIRYILNGATLTIEPGTVIRGESNQPRCSVDNDLCTTNADCTDLSDPADICLRDPGALVVARGARLLAQGTADQPIIFTNLTDDNVGASLGRESGDYDSYLDAFDVNGTWGGVIMLGRGYTNNDTDNPGPQIGPNPARQLAVEGIQNRGRCTQTFNACRLDSQCPGALNTCDLFTGFYGDCASSALSPESCDDDTNGSMRYVSIRYGGDEVSAANEINGLTLGGVGRGTTLDYIEIANNFDDGVELFGGAVDIKHFVITNAGDDAVDYDEGWRGRGQFIFAMAGRPLSSDPRSGEHDGATGGDGGQPRAIPTFYNATYIGAGGVGGGASGTDFHDPAETYGAKAVNANFIFRDNAGGQYYNSAFLNGGGALGLIEGSAASATDNETSGERTITTYALGDANTFASPVGSAPAGNCDDPTNPNDTATRALACDADSDCPGGAVCVLHYLSRGSLASLELELQDNTWHCFGQPLLDGGGVAHFPATLAEVAATGGEVGKLHRDIPGLFNAGSGLDNQYRRCTDPLPIRRLVRVSDPLFFPVGDGENQPVVSVDPRPASGSVLLTTNRTPPSGGFYEAASYRGAFGAANWATGWTATARLGLFPFCSSSGSGPIPDEVQTLKADRLGAVTTRLTWTPATRAGLMGLQSYDVIRSTTASNFSGADCVGTDLETATVDDPDVPLTNQTFFYLVRAVNPCGEGSLGFRSSGVERSGSSCP